MFSGFYLHHEAAFLAYGFGGACRWSLTQEVYRHGISNGVEKHILAMGERGRGVSSHSCSASNGFDLTGG